MSITLIKDKARREALIEHRRFMLDRALELLIKGRATTEYVAMRGNKLKKEVTNGEVRISDRCEKVGFFAPTLALLWGQN
ncbi:unnamed protein product [marine sediment metagenome]|uniref:Uncharacterized protein n=1 Tax=marine sediment metagenome TaxID=412755 RepID=X1IJA2_9ZZZZ